MAAVVVVAVAVAVAGQRSGAMGLHEPEGSGVIVVGLDGSERSWRAAAYAAGLARRQGSMLALTYVQEPQPIAEAVGLGAAVIDTESHAAREIERQLRELAEQRVGDAPPLRWRFYSVSGDVCGGLSAIADELQADAIVVGACRKLCHRFTGSPTVRLVKTAHCPVIVVP
jgi:nucleotide-binding universal stress UspA family protein